MDLSEKKKIYQNATAPEKGRCLRVRCLKWKGCGPSLEERRLLDRTEERRKTKTAEDGERFAIYYPTPDRNLV
jgi:hypothetical protein